jgi:hypothetical protein
MAKKTFFILILAETAFARDAGVLYEVWHTPSALAMQQVVAQDGHPLTVEMVLRSNGTSTLDDILKPYNLTGTAFGDNELLYCSGFVAERPGVQTCFIQRPSSCTLIVLASRRRVLPRSAS